LVYAEALVCNTIMAACVPSWAHVEVGVEISRTLEGESERGKGRRRVFVVFVNAAGSNLGK